MRCGFKKLKPKSMIKKGHEAISLVAFRYDRHYSIAYLRISEPEKVGKQVERLLSEPNNADVISIRRTFVSEEEKVQIEKEQEADKNKRDPQQMPIEEALSQ